MTNLWMVFDVESVGLHGEGFAAGYVVVDGEGKELEARRLVANPHAASGSEQAHGWLRDNLPRDVYDESADASPPWVRLEFWASWLRWKERGALLAADCAWPVEARFLAAYVDADHARREWQGPYPLIDVASVRLAAGFDPLGTEERLPGELPAHDPLCDARQSARLLIEALHKLDGGDGL